MNILKLLFGKSKSIDNNLSPDDIQNIKTLLSILNGFVDFLSSNNELPETLVNKFKTNRQNISRILNFNGLAVYFKRHITTKELDSLLAIIELSDEIIKVGAQKSTFLSGKAHVAQLQDLIKKINHDRKRWV